ncbi:hypothetical protein ACFQ6Q_01950 [Streptomyces sp. NPDC056437]|uniref:hypothetical protein n=1 Tax=Streptomyces sp. NPDC056437 TaxID=3345816 RepID=UPI0036A22BCF
MTDTTARVITGISAAAAAASMLVAYLTYRRLRPRVTIRVQSVHHYEIPNGQPQLLASLRLVNRSASAARVEIIRLRFVAKQGRVRGGSYEPEEPLIIGPMDGVKIGAVFDMRWMNPLQLSVDSGEIIAELGDGRNIRRKLDDYNVISANIAFRKDGQG